MSDKWVPQHKVEDVQTRLMASTSYLDTNIISCN